MIFSTHTHSEPPRRSLLERFLLRRLGLKGRKENQRRRRWRLMREFYSGR
ncbi:MAG: hypothetical protein U5S82_05515 [Gammaproteobacteria bacterium]|nr:hypothetical protein [Gammaproteobacteria bacterium]